MSVINKMLRDLDRRRALPESASPDPNVRVVPQVRRSDAFWITVGFEALVAVGAMAWVIYEMQPRPLATPLALSRPAVPPPTLAVAKPPATPVTPPKEATAAAAPPVELFKLAEAIDTPVPPPPPPAARKDLPKPVKLPPDQALASPHAAAKGVAQAVTKRDIPLSSSDEAEMRFQKGVDRLNQGRASAAAQEFTAALAVQPSYEPARQALVAVRLEQSELDEAEKLLNDGIALSPSNAQFATVLARIRVERGDYDGAAQLLARTNEAGGGDAEHQLLYATVLQHFGRHAEAVPLFENAARLAEPTAAAWVAMAISYENVGDKAQALRSYRQSLAAGASDAMRTYAENRLRALK